MKFKLALNKHALETKEAISCLRQLIAEEVFRYKGKHVHQTEVKHLIDSITADLLTSYDKQRENIAALLFVYEEYTDHFIAVLFTLFINGLEEIKGLNIEQLDLSFWEEEFDIDTVAKEYESFFKQYLKPGQQMRLSSDMHVSIDTPTAGRFLRMIHKLVSHQSLRHEMNVDDVNSMILQLGMARSIARVINRKELFYFLTSIFLDGLHYNQNYQFARDLSEECLICAYKDNLPELGYYLSFKVFASTSSGITALHYAYVANTAFQKKSTVWDYLLKNFFWEAIKFARNIKLIPFAVKLFENRPHNVSYSTYEENKFYHAYFSSLFYLKSEMLPGDIFGYIDKTKEALISTGELEVLPWLSLLLSVKKNYAANEYDTDTLERYITLFRRVVSSHNYKKLNTALFGSVAETAAALKKALLSLSFTRNPSDFVTDNKAALQLSHRNLSESHRAENVDAYLLSMILQSDFSIIFKEKETELMMSIHESYKPKEFEKEYYTPTFLKDFVVKNDDCDVLWLGGDNHLLLPLFFSDGGFTFLNDKERQMIEPFTFARDTIEELPLNTRTEKGEDKLFEDYEQEEITIKQQVNVFALPIEAKHPLLLIKDIELSAFPHNLITTESDFISNLSPLANIMSLEWFVENHKRPFPAHPSTSIWIPVESGD